MCANIVQNYFHTKKYVNGYCPPDPATNSETKNIEQLMAFRNTVQCYNKRRQGSVIMFRHGLPANYLARTIAANNWIQQA